MLKKQKILFFSHHYHIGGGEKSLLYLAKSLENQFITKVFVRKHGTLISLASSWNIQTEVLDFYIKNNKLWEPRYFLRSLKLKRILKGESPWLLHPNTFHDFLSLRKIAFKLRIPIVPFIRGLWEKIDIQQLEFFKIHNLPILTVSRLVKEKLESSGFKVLYLPLGIIPSFVTNCQSENLREKLNIDETFTVFCTIARFSPEKGQNLLLEAVKKLKELTERFRVVLIGDTEFSKNPDFIFDLKNRINSYGLNNLIHFENFTLNPCPYYKACDAIIIPSPRETASRTLQEAMANGKPVVITKYFETLSFLNPGEDILTFDPENIETLKESLFILLDPNLRTHIGKNALKRKDFYDINSYLPKLLDYYTLLVNSFNTVRHLSGN